LEAAAAERELELEASKTAALAKEAELNTMMAAKAELEDKAQEREAELETERKKAEEQQAQLTAMAQERADLEAAALDREAQLEESRKAAVQKAEELEVMAQEKADLENTAAMRQAELEESQKANQQKAQELDTMALEKGILEAQHQMRSQQVSELLHRFSRHTEDRKPSVQSSAFDEAEWVRMCEEAGGSWGEKMGMKAVIVGETEKEAAWECLGCGAMYFAEQWEPEQEEFWGDFDSCDTECVTIRTYGSASRCVTPQGSEPSSPVSY